MREEGEKGGVFFLREEIIFGAAGIGGLEKFWERKKERKKKREKEQLQPRLSRYAPRCFWNSYLYLIFLRARFLNI